MDTKNGERILSYLEKIHHKYEETSQQLMALDIASQQKKFKELSKELARLKPLAEKYQEYVKLARQGAEAGELQKQAEDPEMATLAAAELAELLERQEALLQDVSRMIVADEREDNRNVFLEIRAGAGGNEASLFAADLLRMYLRIAERMNWKAEVVSTAYSAIGGIKEIVLYIRGSAVYKYLKFESGVHRVQRVPVTEAGGRIHTSTVTVAVLPEVEDVEVEINPKDIRVDTFAASGPGGQHVNKTESAIRITHFPTGIVVSCQDEKSQHKNKEKAMKILKARIFEFEKNKRQASIAQDRRSQVGSGERSEKIRTYNFPQSRITDHRVNSRNFNIDFILDGDVNDLMSELLAQHHESVIEETLKGLTV